MIGSPDDHEVHHALGVVYANMKQWSNALTHIQQAITLNQKQHTYFNSLGNVLKQLGRHPEAIKAYQKAITLFPNYAPAYNNLGNAYLLDQQFISAKRAYEKAITLKTDYADAYLNVMNLGQHFLEQHDHQNAQSAFLICIKKMPENAQLNHLLGVTYFYLKDFHSAKKYFETVLMLEHNHPEANQFLANTLLECGDFDTAITYYFRQLEHHPFFETYFNLGVLFMMKNRNKDAIAYYEKALQLNPTDANSYHNLGHIYLKQGNQPLAIDCYEKALELKKNDAEIQHILSALKQNETPTTTPPELITHLFDQYAPYYDVHLTNRLAYDTPQKIKETILLEYPYFSSIKHTIVDLGCGTGLCGSEFKPFANQLIGVDLSENMLALAREKEIYDELLQMDIHVALDNLTAVDLVIAADVFTYCGDLNPLFKKVCHTLNSNGLFIFSVEKTHEKANYVLQTSIRYAHNKQYLIDLAKKYHFEVISINNLILRNQNNHPIDGYLVFLKKTQ